jgi:hypothetical protein
MTGRELRYGENLLAASASIIGGAIGIGVPLTLLIIWLWS